MYRRGNDVPQDYSKAVEWFSLTAHKGDADAQMKLSIMFGIGKGVVQDYIIALMWFNLAAANGNEDGGRNRDKAAQKMTNADISKAQAKAGECMNGGYLKGEGSVADN